MGIKKVARPMNKAKNDFVKWLKKNNAEDIDVFEGEGSSEWDYYRSVSAFIKDKLYIVCFMVWSGEESIDYTDSSISYYKLNIQEFKDLIS